MDIERLRALEKDIRNSGGPGCQYHADQLASLIAELGQEVGAVADSRKPHEGPCGPDTSCDSDCAAAYYDAIPVRVDTSPAHTSEVRENDPTWRLFDRVDFALRDAGFDLDLASAIAARADDFFGDEYDAAMRQEGGTP